MFADQHKLQFGTQDEAEPLFISGSFGVTGGIGHALIDLYTPLFLAELLGLQYVYNGIETVAISRRDEQIKNHDEHQKRFDWNALFGIDELFPSLQQVSGEYDEELILEGHGQWTTFRQTDLAPLRSLIERCRADRRRVLFQVTNNERIWYWQTVFWERCGWIPRGFTQRFKSLIRQVFQNRIETLYPELANRSQLRVSVHVRNSGLWPDEEEIKQAQRDALARISTWLDVHIDVYSEGTPEALGALTELYSGLPARFHFNTDTVQTFVELATSDVLAGGKSSFFMQAGLLCPGLKLGWHDYDTALAEMVADKQETMVVDDEWLLATQRLERSLLLERLAARVSKQ